MTKEQIKTLDDEIALAGKDAVVGFSGIRDYDAGMNNGYLIGLRKAKEIMGLG